MSENTWPPHVTVAAVVEKDGKYLLVEENDNHRKVFNQPAGHLEPGESLIEAAIRETLEESAWHVQPTAILGLSHYLAPNGVSYLRTTFLAKPLEHNTNRQLDEDIIQVHWLPYNEIYRLKKQLRSPMVLADIERHRSGVEFPLGLYQEHS